jgi:UDP-glucose 4-epimerase
VKELARLVAEAMGVEPRLQLLPARREVQHAHADHARARRVFAAHLPAPTPLGDGLAVMAAHVKRHPLPSPTPCPAPIEIRAGLPPSWQSLA